MYLFAGQRQCVYLEFTDFKWSSIHGHRETVQLVKLPSVLLINGLKRFLIFLTHIYGAAMVCVITKKTLLKVMLNYGIHNIFSYLMYI